MGRVGGASAESGTCRAGECFVFEQQPLREGKQLLHSLFDLTHTHTASAFTPSITTTAECHGGTITHIKRKNTFDVSDLCSSIILYGSV